jgi:hypothetical protein
MWRDKNGTFSASKFWATVANATGTFVIIKVTLLGNITAELLFSYMAVVGGADVVKKGLTMHYGDKETR